MRITANTLPLPPAPEQNPVSATAAATTGQGGNTCRLENFGGLLGVMVVGNPSENAIGMLESHFRALNSAPESRETLRQLRQQTEQQGVYPVLVFDDASNGEPITLRRDLTARPGEQIDLKAPANSPPPGGQGKENAVMDLIGRVADDLSKSQREYKSFMPSLGAPLPDSMPAHLTAYLEALRNRPTDDQERLTKNQKERLDQMPALLSALPNRLQAIREQQKLHVSHIGDLREGLDGTAINLARAMGASRAESEANRKQAEQTEQTEQTGQSTTQRL